MRKALRDEQANNRLTAACLLLRKENAEEAVVNPPEMLPQNTPLSEVEGHKEHSKNKNVAFSRGEKSGYSDYSP